MLARIAGALRSVLRRSRAADPDEVAARLEAKRISNRHETQKWAASDRNVPPITDKDNR